METLPLSNWLESELGLPPLFIVGILQPLVIFSVMFLLREVALFVGLRRWPTPDQKKWVRRVSLYLTVLVGIAFVGIFWRLLSFDWLHGHLAGLAPTSRLETYLRGGINGIVATAVLFFSWSVIRRSDRYLEGKLDKWSSSSEAIRFQGAALLSRQALGNGVRVALRVATWLSIATTLYAYVPLMMSFFPLTQPYADKLLPYVSGPVQVVLLGVLGYVPRLLTLVVILVLMRLVLKLTKTFMNAIGRDEVKIPGFDSEWAEPTFRLVRIGIYLLTVIISYPYLPGSGSEIFKGFSVFIGALITLGSSAAINNIISGIVLTYTRSFRVGDRVRIGGTLGDVNQKGLFVTRVQTLEGEMITVPNGKVLASEVANLSEAVKEDGLSVVVSVGIGYDVDWRRVHELMQEAASKTPGIESEPAPIVLQTALGDYAVSYVLIGKTLEPERLRVVKSELMKYVLDVFNREGVEIMTPSVSALRDGNQPAIPASYDPSPVSMPGLSFLAANRSS